MSLSKRMFLADEELGKKDDDHHRKPARFRQFSLASWRLPRRRRIYAVIASVIICYLLFSHVFSDTYDDESSAETPPLYPSYPISQGVSRPKGPPPVSDGKRDQNKRYYNGPIRFYTLAKSLYSVRGFMGYRRENKIVLFAAANLKCLSDLLPLACEMSESKLNRVHVALMGRDDVSLEGIQEVNSFNETECSLVWHDARPDYGPWSTDMRMGASVKSAFAHIYTVLQPHVVITHESRDEPFLNSGIRLRAAQADITHIGLRGRVSSFKWITKLDSKALAVWNKVQVEILVQAPPASSGSLLRLLRSLQNANYFGSPPGLTIELPYDVDPLLVEFLADFTWPPQTENRQFTLRRRITHNITTEEAAMRNIDSFYPRDPWYSHVLVLSPQTEMAPSFYHYLKYSLLKYKYSTTDTLSAYQLLGISLDLPSFKPTDGHGFSPPKSDSGSFLAEENNVPVFLWQAPNSNAALYFGDKWIEFHSFLSNRLAPSLKTKQKSRPKYILDRYASWMEYMMEFIQARGYYLLYQSFAAEDDLSLTTVHNELFRIPEEHASVPKAETPHEDHEQANSSDQTLSGEVADRHAISQATEKNLLEAPSISPLLDAYPGHLPPLSSLKILSSSGVAKGWDTLLNATEEYATAFKTELGGCDAQQEPPDFVALSANDLFCLE